MRNVITTASIASAFAVAMAQGVASAQGLSDLASGIVDAINSDVFWSAASAAVAAAPEQAAIADAIAADVFSSEAFAGLAMYTDTSTPEPYTVAYALPERIKVNVVTLPALAPAAPVFAAAMPAPVTVARIATTRAAGAPAAVAATPVQVATVADMVARTPAVIAMPVASTVTLDDLAGVSAGAEPITQLNEQRANVTGTVTGNSINASGNLDVTNGTVNFSGNALSQFTGIGNFVINTGNNNNVIGTLSVQITTGATAGISFGN